MTSPSTPSPALKRFQINLLEQLVYCIDVLAATEDDARQIALETEMKGDPSCLSFDVDQVFIAADDDATFNPINACVRCKHVMEDYEQYPHCPACIENIKAERR